MFVINILILVQVPESESGYEYQALSGDLDNIGDLVALIGNCDTAISNAEQFMSQLGDKLSLLDGVIYHLYICIICFTI